MHVINLCSYLIAEVLFSLLYINGAIYRPTSAWIFENSGKTIHFDPVRGYKLSPTPSRFARITEGTIEYVGTWRGNSQGFPDRDDFSSKRKDPDSLRLTVFGDSFTAAQYIDKNWPDALEDLDSNSQAPINVELLNFSTDGGGLANWWSNLTHILEKERYEVDGIVFAVFGDDLHRGFSISEHRGYSRHMFAYLKSWNPEDWPKNRQEAQSILKPLSGYIVTEDEFSKALDGTWHPKLPRPWKPYLFIEAHGKLQEKIKIINSKFINRLFVQPESKKSETGQIFSQEQKELIRQISIFAQINSLPVIVVRIPSRPELIEKLPPREDVLLFSKLLDATFIDGGEAFSNLTEIEIRSHWLPYDGHWAQSGSDRFAHFFHNKLKDHGDDLFKHSRTNADKIQSNSR